MPKPNAMLARIEAAAKARYQARLHTSMDMLLQLGQDAAAIATHVCLLYTSPSPRDRQKSRMPSSA